MAEVQEAEVVAAAAAAAAEEAAAEEEEEAAAVAAAVVAAAAAMRHAALIPTAKAWLATAAPISGESGSNAAVDLTCGWPWPMAVGSVRR